VADEVRQRLREAVSVSAELRQILGDGRLEIDLFRCGDRLVTGDDVSCDGCRIDCVAPDGKLPLLGLCDIEQVVNESLHASCRRNDRLNVLGLLVGRATRDQLRTEPDRRERAAQVVGDDAEDLVADADELLLPLECRLSRRRLFAEHRSKCSQAPHHPEKKRGRHGREHDKPECHPYLHSGECPDPLAARTLVRRDRFVEAMNRLDDGGVVRIERQSLQVDPALHGAMPRREALLQFQEGRVELRTDHADVCTERLHGGILRRDQPAVTFEVPLIACCGGPRQHRDLLAESVVELIERRAGGISALLGLDPIALSLPPDEERQKDESDERDHHDDRGREQSSS
ncbi:MAG TPA: hypothetical protein VF608_00585, partial [Thermoanaerobaculia bacterium]